MMILWSHSLCVSFSCWRLFLYLHTNSSRWALALPPGLSLSLSLSVGGLIADWLVSFGWRMSLVPAQVRCLYTGVMDSVAADTTHISLSCPVPWGWTVIAHLHTAMATPYMAQEEWLIARLWGNAFCFPVKVLFTFCFTVQDVTARLCFLQRRYWSQFTQMSGTS